MTRYKAILSIASTLIGQALPGYANPDLGMLDGLARAIDTYANEDWEAETLIRIAWWESGLRREHVDCTVVNGKARGAYQVVPFTRAEALDACSSNLDVQTKLALSRVRSSRQQCERLGYRGSDVLGVYTTGRCQRGEPFARLRFGDGFALRSLMLKP